MAAPHSELDDKIANVEFQYVKDDFIAAYQLYGAATRRIWLLISMFTFIVLVASFIYLREVTQAILAAAFIPAGAAVGGLLQRAYLGWLGRHCFANDPLSHLEQKLALRPDGIALQNLRGAGSFQWKDFIRWRANNKTTLIYTSPTTFLNFPARLAELGFPIDRLRLELLRELGAPLR